MPPALAALLRGDGAADADDEGLLPKAIATIEAKLPNAENATVQLLACDLAARDFLPDAFGAETLADAAAKAATFQAWLEAMTPEKLQGLLDTRKNYRDDAASDADLKDLDPEAAAKKKDDERRARQVEAMLAEIMANKDGPTDHDDQAPKDDDKKDGDFPGGLGGFGTPLFGKKKQ